MTKKELIIFGKQLKKLRVSAKLSQEKLAEKADLHRNYIGDVERGERNPTLLTLMKISKALGISLSDLLKNIE